MLKTFCDDPKGQRLDLGDGLVAVVAVAQHASQGRHFGQPAAISFAFQFDGEGHRSTVYPRSAAQQAAEADGELALRPPIVENQRLGAAA